MSALNICSQLAAKGSHNGAFYAVLACALQTFRLYGVCIRDMTKFAFVPAFVVDVWTDHESWVWQVMERNLPIIPFSHFHTEIILSGPAPLFSGGAEWPE